MGKEYYVYILASKRNGTLYVGVTSNLKRRVNEHQEKEASEFTRKYQVNQLVYYESFQNMKDALSREKQLKTGNVYGK